MVGFSERFAPDQQHPVPRRCLPGHRKLSVFDVAGRGNAVGPKRGPGPAEAASNDRTAAANSLPRGRITAPIGERGQTGAALGLILTNADGGDAGILHSGG